MLPPTPTPAPVNPSDVTLREVIDSDLPTFFTHQLDPIARHLAAFTCKDPTDHAAFLTHWSRIRRDPDITLRSILYRIELVGHIAAFGPPAEKELTYWLSRPHWNKGITTQALTQFLPLVTIRPLHARVAHDNHASLRLLHSHGFTPTTRSPFFSHARGHEIDEVLLILP